MKGISYRNKNEGKRDANGKPKKPNWCYRFEMAKVNGVRKFKEQSGFSTKKEAIEAGTAAYNEYITGGSVFEATEMSYSDVLDSWLENYVKINCNACTRVEYTDRVDRYVRPELGGYAVVALRRETIQLFMNQKFQEHFSRNSLVNILGLITSSLRYARRMGWIELNPADDIDIPRERLCTENSKKVREPIPRDVLSKVFERFPEGHPAHVPLMIAYHCGLRLGEVFGLTWEDIDLKKGGLTVNHQVQWVQEKAEYKIVPPKYGSTRTVRMDNVLWQLLKREKVKNTTARIGLGSTYKQLFIDEDGFLNTEKRGQEAHMVTIRMDGSYIQPRTTQHYSHVVKTELGFEKFDFHSLRHTHATELSEAGVNLKEIQRRLGHSTMEVTSKRYLHATKAMEQECVERMNEMYMR